jgi:hypothetical protein
MALHAGLTCFTANDWYYFVECVCVQRGCSVSFYTKEYCAGV